MSYCDSMLNVIIILSNSTTIWQNMLVYRIFIDPIESIKLIIAKYYGITTEQVNDFIIENNYL